jgi:hypothetical protein
LQLRVEVNEPPWGGTLTLDRRIGLEASTVFEARMYNWVDKQRDKPLTYVYFMRDLANPTGPLTPLGPRTSENVFRMVRPTSRVSYLLRDGSPAS